LADVKTGNTPPRDIPAYYGDHIEWIKSDNIKSPSHYLTKATEYLSRAGVKVGRTAPSGATLVTCIAGSPACIGNAALADRQVAFNQQINALVPKDDIEPEFLYANVLFSKPKIQAASTQGMKGMVSKSALAQVRLIAPPARLRKRFVQFFLRIHATSRRLEAAAVESEQLFQSLSVRTFNSELVCT
jgi:type I restriction enzyme S subunit